MNSARLMDALLIVAFLCLCFFLGSRIAAPVIASVAPRPLPPLQISAPPARDDQQADEYVSALRENPFTPHRRSGGARFTLSTPSVNTGSQTTVEAREPILTLAGTTLLPDGKGFAAVKVDDAAAVTVAVGQTISGWEVQSIARGKVRLVRGSRTLELEVSRPEW